MKRKFSVHTSGFPIQMPPTFMPVLYILNLLVREANAGDVAINRVVKILEALFMFLESVTYRNSTSSH